MTDLNRKPTPIVGEANPKLRLGVYGEGGVGKTTLALSFPHPLVIDTDGGLEGDAVVGVDGDEWTPDKWQDLNALARYIKERVDQDGYKTIIIDSIDTLCNFLRHEAEKYPTAGRPANASETQMITASEQDYGKVATAVDIFFSKLRILQQEHGLHIVLTSAVRGIDRDKDRNKRTFDCQPAVEGLLLKWLNVYGELTLHEIPAKVEGQDPTEGRILWTRASDPLRKNKARWSAIRPGVKTPTFDRIVGLIEGTET